MQAADASEFKSFDEFKQAIIALPLEFKLEPTPTVKMTTLRGKKVEFTYDKAPIVDGRKIDYAKWKLFEGPYLNAEKGSFKDVTIKGSETQDDETILNAAINSVTRKAFVLAT